MNKAKLMFLKKNAVSLILKTLYSTNRFHIEGRGAVADLHKKNKSVIISTWHSDLLSVFYNLKDFNVHALAGTHNDAELISQVALKWGWKMIRGSSKEDGSIAYKGILKTLRTPGSIVFITPDGPTGPPKIPKPGIIRAAQTTQAAIIPTSVFATRRWGFKNWDTFYLEKPFGKIFINYGDPIYIDKKLNHEEVENLFKIGMNESSEKNLYNASKFQ